MTLLRHRIHSDMPVIGYGDLTSVPCQNVLFRVSQQQLTQIPHGARLNATFMCPKFDYLPLKETVAFTH